MPVPPPLSTNPVAVARVPLPFGLVAPTGQTQTTNTNANPNAQMQLVGTDAQPYSGLANPSVPTKITVTFPNLPVRMTRLNPLNLPTTGGKNDLIVGPGLSYLMLVCFVQGTPIPPGPVVTAAPQAITASGAVVPGPFLGAEHWRTFQAVVTIANAPISATVKGTVVAHLMLAVG